MSLETNLQIKSQPSRGSSSTPKVLLVDDEYSVLVAVKRHLRGLFDVTLAEGGPAGIELAKGPENFAAVCTDMRMPEADGLAVLRAFKEHQPDTTRMLFTGFADVEGALAAVNEGNIFRFLTKPTDPDTLKKSLADAVDLYRLKLAEQELLEQTLRGAVQALAQTLSLAGPQAFARATRVERIVTSLLNHVEIEDRWTIQVAVVLSQVGAVTLPPRVVDKLHHGSPLNQDEQDMVDQLPGIANRLLIDIPRLEEVRAIITELSQWQFTTAPLGTKLLRIAQDIDTLEARDMEADVVLTTLMASADDYGEVAMNAATAMLQTDQPKHQIKRIPANEIREGMMLAMDINTSERLLLVGRGQVVTEGILRRIANFASNPGLEDDIIAVFVEEDSPSES